VHECVAIVDWHAHRQGETLGDLLRGAKVVGLDLSHGDRRAAHAPRQLILRQAQRAPPNAHELSKGGALIHNLCRGSHFDTACMVVVFGNTIHLGTGHFKGRD